MRIDRWAVVLALGTSLGIATAAADVLSGGLPPNEAARAASVILNAGSTWAAVAVAAGWLVGHPPQGAFAGAAALLAAVVGYYAFGVLLGDRTEVGFAGVAGVLRLWALAAVVAGPVLGLVGAAIRSGGRIGLVASLVVPAGVVVEMIGLRRLDGRTFAVDPVLATTQGAMVAGAVVAGCAFLLRPGVPSTTA